MSRQLKRLRVLLLSPIVIAIAALQGSVPTVRSVCEISQHFSRFHDKVVTVRGVYYYSLQQQCPGKCANGVWPSFIELRGGADSRWSALAKTIRQVEAEAKQTSKRFEIWITVSGRLDTGGKRSPLGPCDRMAWGHFGHLGVAPAEITVETIRDIEVRVNSKSPYDYGNMHHGTG
jgi:hypothetical protein